MFKKYIRKKMEKLLYELQHEPDYMSDQYIKSYKRGWNDALKTVAELFEMAFNGEKIDGYQITVGGQNRDANYVPRPNENITVAKMIKGNL